MPKADLTELAVRLEEHLGDPHDPDSAMSYRTILEYDERETYPYDFVGALRAWGVPEYALPGEQGGRSGDVEAEFNLLRLVARRDPTTATALIITNLGFMPLWIAGTDEQKRRMVHAILHGYRLSWGLSERVGTQSAGFQIRSTRLWMCAERSFSPSAGTRGVRQRQ
jgi:alkylation response protein AidB-like acyl-CoA dehydrogenase